MENDREILRTVWQRADSCPELPVLLDGLERGDAELKKHLAGCAHCTAEVALYRDVVDGPSMPDFDSRNLNQRLTRAVTAGIIGTAPVERWWSRLLRPSVFAPVMAAAAVLLVVVGIGIQQRHSAVPYENVERSQAVEMLSPKGDLAAAPAVLQWSGVSGATAYRIRILEVDRNILWEATAKTTTSAVPASIQKQALPGKRLIWTVEAFNNKGEIVANGSQDFRRTIVRRESQQ